MLAFPKQWYQVNFWIYYITQIQPLAPDYQVFALRSYQFLFQIKPCQEKVMTQIDKYDENKNLRAILGDQQILPIEDHCIQCCYLFSRHEVVFLEFYQFSNMPIKPTPPTFKQQRTNHYILFTYLIGSIFLDKLKFALWILWQLIVRKPLSPSSSFP